jgi:anti-sigma factor ChrR (cupin superfamily)
MGKKEEKHIKFKDVKWEKTGEDILEKHLIKDEEGIHINLLKLEPNKQIPHHKHSSTKYNYILKGSMSDENGEYKEGDLGINKKGSEHSIKAGSEGCEFLVIWNATGT